MTKKDKALIKEALRRAFSRSDLRRSVIEKSIVTNYKNVTRRRVKTWCKCNICNKLDAISYMVVDHINPVVPVTTPFEDMSIEDLLLNVFCSETNLQTLCKECHYIKSGNENKARRAWKKENGNSSKKSAVRFRKTRR